MKLFQQNIIFYVGAVAGLILPFFNIPLILKICRNKSSRDISLIWVVGVWICIVGMLPQQIISPDLSFKLFGIVNFFLFSAVVVVVYWYRKK